MNKHFEITVTVSSEPVENSVLSVWKKSFEIPDRNYRNEPEYGYREVVRQVKQYIDTLDMTDIIARTARYQLNGAVEDAVGVVLREYAKKKAKEMLSDGTLLGGNK